MEDSTSNTLVLQVFGSTLFSSIHTHSTKTYRQIIGIVEKWISKFVEPKFSGFRRGRRFLSLALLFYLGSLTFNDGHVINDDLPHFNVAEPSIYYREILFLLCFFISYIKAAATTTRMSTSIEHKHDYDVMICYLFSVHESSFFVCCWWGKSFFPEKTRINSFCLLSCSLQLELVNLLLCILFNQITIKIKLTQPNQLFIHSVHKKNDPMEFNGVIILIAQWCSETVQGPSIAPKNTHLIRFTRKLSGGIFRRMRSMGKGKKPKSLLSKRIVCLW